MRKTLSYTTEETPSSNIIINTSTFSTPDNPSPGFLNDLVESLNKVDENLNYTILTPNYKNGSEKINFKSFDIYRYNYFYPRNYQNLSKIGLLPSLKNNKLNFFKVMLLIFSQFIALNKLINKSKPILIVNQWLFPQAFCCYLLSIFKNINYCFTSHGSEVKILNKIPFLGKFLVKKIVKNSYKFTSVSNLNLEQIKNSTSFDKEKFKIIPMSISEESFEVNNSIEKQSEVLNLLFIGRLTEYKGLNVLIKSLSILKEQNIKFKLNILGNGSCLETYQKLVNRLNLKNEIFFEGFKDKNIRNNYLSNADLLIVPSIETKLEIEGGPLTLIEGMAANCICIISDSVGFLEHCSDKNSIIFKSGDAFELAEKIIFYKNMNTNEINKMKKNGFETSQLFRPQKIAIEHYNFLIKDLI
ncbi:MAG: hypothetical protein CMQ83_01125 [Gammaproteobacteria bacterium]|nr:hypothetical protein [Gammaproteobacteria bacterium]|tara:strand:+ start:2266 stop:3507 length:1242 start_codon:yes stop_codon:yes gene_type:complete